MKRAGPSSRSSSSKQQAEVIVALLEERGVHQGEKLELFRKSKRHYLKAKTKAATKQNSHRSLGEGFLWGP